MNNREWLYSLDVADLADWFDSEHESTLDGDTAAENADSRELLDADVRKWCGKYAYQADMVWTWLNRQAAITERECLVKSVQGADAMLTAECAELQGQVDELTADLNKEIYERERYRKKFGKCLDYADAIHALMDEGMA